jgi:hypothetical protein
MATCPICGLEAALLDKIGALNGFDCPAHGRFKVSGTVLAIRLSPDREQWEAALKRASVRQPKEWAPVVQSYDF